MGTPNEAQQAIDTAVPGAANLDGFRVLVQQAKAGELYLACPADHGRIAQI